MMTCQLDKTQKRQLKRVAGLNARNEDEGANKDAPKKSDAGGIEREKREEGMVRGESESARWKWKYLRQMKRCGSG
jgi:hypothetical protein